MKMKKYWIWVIVSFSIVIVLWPARQITGETGLSAKDEEAGSNLTAFQKSASSHKLLWAGDKEVLQGLEGVSVWIEPIEQEVEKHGLTRQAIQTDTELQLRQYGIKVLTEEELLSTPTVPILFINVNVMIHEKIPVVAAALDVELREAVLLLREPKRFCCAARTWKTGVLVLVGLDKIKDLRGDIKDLVNEFINDYLAANPKDHSTKKNGSVFDDLKKPKDN